MSLFLEDDRLDEDETALEEPVLVPQRLPTRSSAANRRVIVAKLLKLFAIYHIQSINLVHDACVGRSSKCVWAGYLSPSQVSTNASQVTARLTVVS